MCVCTYYLPIFWGQVCTLKVPKPDKISKNTLYGLLICKFGKLIKLFKFFSKCKNAESFVRWLGLEVEFVCVCDG